VKYTQCIYVEICAKTVLYTVLIVQMSALYV
jgi:hypothetical protein